MLNEQTVQNEIPNYLHSFSETERIDLEELVKTKLFPLPSSVSQILDLLRDINVTAKQIAEVIEFDPILATRILRLANSSIYSLQREIITIHQAVLAIGVRSIYDIAMLGVASDVFSRKMCSINTSVSIWEHSVAVAIASREISKVLKIRAAEEAFTCGLLHDIGQTLLFQINPVYYNRALSQENEKDLIEVEEELFGYNHFQVGFFVAHKWKLPTPVRAAILHHHHPNDSPEAVVIAHVVNVADDLAQVKGFGLKVPEEGELPSSESVIKLRLSNKQMEEAWEKTKIQLDETLNNFK